MISTPAIQAEKRACPICSDSLKFSFEARVLGRHPAQFHVCDGCGYLCAPEPYWLEEAYSSAIAAADTGLVTRNFSVACRLAGVLYWVAGGCRRKAPRYLDIAGGYGMLTRLMRDFGFDFYWSDKYCNNLLAPGFEYSRDVGTCDAVTAIEVFEHLTDPVAFVKEALALSGAQTLIFTTELYEGPSPQPESWWYYSFATGQHIGFFQRRTLETLGASLGLRFYTSNGIHVLSSVPLNAIVLRAVTSRWLRFILPWWVRYRLGSKTQSDHQRMLDRIK